MGNKNLKTIKIVPETKTQTFAILFYETIMIIIRVREYIDNLINLVYGGFCW